MEEGQQKFEGRLVLPQVVRLGSPQVLESRVRRPRAWAALTAVERAVVEGTVVDIRHTTANFARVVFPILRGVVLVNGEEVQCSNFGTRETTHC